MGFKLPAFRTLQGACWVLFSVPVPPARLRCSSCGRAGCVGIPRACRFLNQIIFSRVNIAKLLSLVCFIAGLMRGPGHLPGKDRPLSSGVLLCPVHCRASTGLTVAPGPCPVAPVPAEVL